jgi:hypothetical protein
VTLFVPCRSPRDSRVNRSIIKKRETGHSWQFFWIASIAFYPLRSLRDLCAMLSWRVLLAPKA